MFSAATALVCALAALNRSAESLPPIEIVDTAPPYVSTGTEAFVRHSTGTIYVIASTSVVRMATGQHGECGDIYAVKKLASILIHEEWHLKHGPDEKSAYERQLIALQQLGVGPGTGVYRDVHLAMLHVLAAQKRNRTVLLAER